MQILYFGTIRTITHPLELHPNTHIGTLNVNLILDVMSGATDSFHARISR